MIAITDEQAKEIVDAFYELKEELSIQSKGSLMTEQWEVLEYLEKQLKSKS